MRNPPLPTKGYIREWAIIGLFSCLTLIMLFPLSTHLSSMVPEPTDPLLNAWRMQWNTRALLSGPAGIANLFNTNIFYPFPLTLAYSEHFLMISAQALPFLVLADSHLFGMNLSVLITFVLSGYGMYLLVTEWAGRRWAGLVAGVLFAYSPHRFGQLNHLELLVTQWMPLTLLALHWTLTRRGWRYPTLFILFFNLQALSGFHFSFNLTIACVLLALVYIITKRVYWRGGLWLGAALSALVTLSFNWPIWRMYLRFSDVMGAIRTPGEVRIYSAALMDYLTAIPHNLLYGWTFNQWQLENHQTQPLMPVGIVGILLAGVGLISLIKKKHGARSLVKDTDESRNTQYVSRNIYQSRYTTPTIIFLFLLTLISLLLSFGLNENALGSALAPLLKYSPYFWLYDNVLAFQGIRVPGRYGILVVVGLTGLAGFGVAHLSLITYHLSLIKSQIVIVTLIVLIVLESWSVRLNGPEFPAGQDIPQVYHWLQGETSPDSVVLELPFQGPSEFIYEYYSSHHWRRLANGGTGFTPPIYKELRPWFNNFPDPRSVDIIQQIGIDLVVLHRDSYQPDAWQRVLDDFPLYLPAIEQVRQIDEALVFRIAKPPCRTESNSVNVTLDSTELDGLPSAIAVNYHNSGPAAFVADVQRPSHLTFANGTIRSFTEPLVTPAGEVQSVIVPLRNEQQINGLTGAQLTTLERVVSEGNNQAPAPKNVDAEIQWQPLGLKYANGPQLVAYHLSPEVPTACALLTVGLKWTNSQPDDRAIVQLLDPFGRIVAQDMTQPWSRLSSFSLARGVLDMHTLPLVGSLPAGQYGLRVLVQTAGGVERLPVTTEEGITIPTNQIPPLPVIIHPAHRPFAADNFSSPRALFSNNISLLDARLVEDEVAAGDWLRFALVWKIEHPIDTELTVFTQLIGPDGRVWGQRDNQPGGGWYGVSLWLPDRPVIDDYAFQIQPDAPPGVYRLLAGLYHSDTLERLPVQAGEDFVEVATVRIDE